MRIQSIDFLRGLAIILVLFRHIDYAPIVNFIGWSGVDLFFVLSGFLVSGLLFNEYQKTKTVRPFLFLARRGFKIYPLFWATLIYLVVVHHFTGFGTDTEGLLAELFFYQNYSEKTLMAVTWSLAVEEHFYILLIIAFTIGVKTKKIDNKKSVHLFAFIILGYCLVARILTTIQYPEYNFLKHYTPTHLRIDSLTFGVLIAYNYYFNKAWLSAFVNKHKYQLLFVTLICLVPMFFFNSHTVFMRTIGFTITYIGFGSLLCLFLFVESFNRKVEKTISPVGYQVICEIGMYSYAIYLTHIQVLNLVKGFTSRYIGMYISENTLFVCYFILSIIIGGILTFLIENPFLKLREKIVPSKKKKEVITDIHPAAKIA